MIFEAFLNFEIVMASEINLSNKKTLGSVSASDILYKFLLLLAVFDGVRSWMVAGGNYLAILKEVTVCFLVLLVVLKNGSKAYWKTLLISNVPFIVYLAVFGTFIIWFNDFDQNQIMDRSIIRYDQPNKYILHFKTIEAFVIIYLLLNYEEVTGRNIKFLLNYFVLLCTGMILFTLLVYFVIDLSAIFEAHWYGRISIGYPPADTQVLSFALAYLLFVRGQFRSRYKIVLIIILIFGIVMNATGTGLLSLIFIFLFLTLFSFWTGSVLRIMKWSNALFVLISFGLIVLTATVIGQGGRQLDGFSEVIEKKINSVKSRIFVTLQIGDQTVTDDPSVDVRKNQITKAFNSKNDAVTMVVGGPISIGTLIENENFFVLRTYGYLGLLFYYIWIFYCVVLSIKNLRNENGRLFLMTLIILMLSNLSLVTTYMFGVAVSYALLISFCIINIRRKYLTDR